MSSHSLSYMVLNLHHTKDQQQLNPLTFKAFSHQWVSSLWWVKHSRKLRNLAISNQLLNSSHQDSKAHLGKAGCRTRRLLSFKNMERSFTTWIITWSKTPGFYLRKRIRNCRGISRLDASHTSSLECTSFSSSLEKVQCPPLGLASSTQQGRSLFSFASCFWT